MASRAKTETVIVGIGASAGGLAALQTFFNHLPEKTGMAYVVITHLSPKHESHLADLLQQKTSISVVQVTESVVMEADHTYIIPPNKNLVIEGGRLVLSDKEKVRNMQTTIDLFFKSMAEACGKNCIAIVMSGTGSDGAEGLMAVKDHGGLTMVQSQEEAEYDSMPQSAIETGAVDIIMTVADMARDIVEIFENRADERMSEADTVAMQTLLDMVHASSGHDFRDYKRPTLIRRIRRRVQLADAKTIPEYLEYVQLNSTEIIKLRNDFLLTVTQFFRDTKSFEVLENSIIPKIFESTHPNESIRVWSCGCATGEEPYSIAILLMEKNGHQSDRHELNVFASDISEEALKVGRLGWYPATIEKDVSASRLQRFYKKDAEGYRVRNELRETILFSNHNVLSDPPFAKLNMVVCRNLLIYLDRSIQKRVFELFYYALKPGGYLFLGNSESIDTNDLFIPVDKSNSVYRKNPNPKGANPFPSLGKGSKTRFDSLDQSRSTKTVSVNLEALHWKSIQSYTPSALLLNSDFDVLHTIGGGERYLRYIPGKPTQNILLIVREELRLELRTALYQAIHKKKTCKTKPMNVLIDGITHQISMIVEPVEDSVSNDNLVQVVFIENDKSQKADAQGSGSDDTSRGTVKPRTMKEADRIIHELENELDRLKNQNESNMESYDTAIEDLNASNEEQKSINEELMSTAEELETSKEEQQSMNEELLTVNQELKSKVEEVRHINSDLQNLMNSTQIATIFLDRKLQIMRFTPTVKDVFNIIPSDIGRLMSHVNNLLDYKDLATDAERVYREAIMLEREVQNVESKQWFLVRVRPYRTVEDKIDGVVLSFIEITTIKTYEDKLEALNKSLESMVKKRTVQVRRLASDIVLTEQNERQRIGQMLHDDLQQQLFVIKTDLKLLQKEHPTLKGEDGIDLLQNIILLLDDSIQATRDLSSTIGLPKFKGKNLMEAMTWLIEYMEGMHDLKVEVKVDDQIRLQRNELIILLIQMIRELLFNIVKHAGVDEARVTISRTQNNLRIRVEDDGVGFDVSTLSQSTNEVVSYGLKTIRERLSLFDSQIDIDSKPKGGTRVTLLMPLEQIQR